jgi:hypothetical protein
MYRGFPTAIDHADHNYLITPRLVPGYRAITAHEEVVSAGQEVGVSAGGPASAPPSWAANVALLAGGKCAYCRYREVSVEQCCTIPSS